MLCLQQESIRSVEIADAVGLNESCGPATASDCVLHRRSRRALFRIVFGAGFRFGAIRTLWVIPRLGSRTAELLETPVMFVVTIRPHALDCAPIRDAFQFLPSHCYGLHCAGAHAAI
jgi:hypothetical protein